MWTDDLFKGYITVRYSGSDLTPRRTIEFVGATVADDPVTRRTVVTIPTVTGLPDAEVGDMVYRGTTGWETLGKGADGDVLSKVAGVDTPRWAPPAGGDSRWDWEDSIDFEVPDPAGAETHVFTTPLPIPATVGAYLVRMEIVISGTDSDIVSTGAGVILTNPLRFPVFRNSEGNIIVPGGGASIASLWALAVAGGGSSANMTPTGATLEVVDGDVELHVAATYGTVARNYRWTARATIEGIAVSA